MASQESDLKGYEIANYLRDISTENHALSGMTVRSLIYGDERIILTAAFIETAAAIWNFANFKILKIADSIDDSDIVNESF